MIIVIVFCIFLVHSTTVIMRIQSSNIILRMGLEEVKCAVHHLHHLLHRYVAMRKVQSMHLRSLQTMVRILKDQHRAGMTGIAIAMEVAEILRTFGLR